MTHTPLDKPPNFDMYEDSALHRAAKQKLIEQKNRKRRHYPVKGEDIVTCPECGCTWDRKVEGHASSVEGASRATAGR